MALLILLVIALLGGLGIVFTPLLLVGAGLLIVWGAGFLIRRRGRRWFAW